jgi:hypothetical protein
LPAKSLSFLFLLLSNLGMAEKKHLKVRGVIEPKAQDATAGIIGGNEESPQKKALADNKGSAHHQKKPKKLPNAKIIAAIVIIVLIAALFVGTFFYKPYRYAFAIGGVNYYSNDYTPTEFANLFKQNKAAYVSPSMVETAADPQAANAMNLWIVVLYGNDINAIQLIRATDKQGNLLSCYTNFGDVRTMKEMTSGECLGILNDSANAVVMIEQGTEDKAFLSKNKIEVTSSASAKVGATNFSVLKEFFPNAQEQLDKANQFIYDANTQKK